MHKPQERIFLKQNVYNLGKEWRQHFQPDLNSLSANPQILYKTEHNHIKIRSSFQRILRNSIQLKLKSLVLC